MGSIALCPNCGCDLRLVERDGRIVGARCERCAYYTGVAGAQRELFEPGDLAPPTQEPLALDAD